VTSIDELKLRIVAAIERGKLQMLENIWREFEYRLDILLAKKGENIEVVWHFTLLILNISKPFVLHFHIP